MSACPLTAAEIALLVAEARPLVLGARVEDLHQTDAHTVYLTLYSRSAGKLCLLLSTRPGFARFHFVADRPPAPLDPPGFCAAARKQFRGAELVDLRQVSGDRVVELEFACRDDASGTGAVRSLVLELTGRLAHLVGVAGDRTVLVSLHERKPQGGTAPGGETYRFPPPRPQPAQLKALGASESRYLKDAEPAPDDLAAPFHYAISRHYERSEGKAIIEEKRAALATLLKREVKKRRDVLQRVAEDLARTERADRLHQEGELLKGALHELRRGLESIELADYYDPELKPVRIQLDPTLTPQKNIERCFRRSQKLKRARGFLAARQEGLAADIAWLEAALERAGRSEALDELAEIEAASEARGIGRRRVSSRRAGRQEPAASAGPRRFVSRDGLEILVGRNARENDRLTMQVARGNDLFFHVAARPGAHVILRVAPGKPAPLESLLDAAQLALYYSLPERSRGQGAAGASADVDYAPVKHVRKPRGARPGLVLLAQHKTLRVRLEADRLGRLRRTPLEGGPGAGQPEGGSAPRGPG